MRKTVCAVLEVIPDTLLKEAFIVSKIADIYASRSVRHWGNVCAKHNKRDSSEPRRIVTL